MGRRKTARREKLMGREALILILHRTKPQLPFTSSKERQARENSRGEG